MKKSSKQPKETDEEFLRRVGLWSTDRKRGIQHSDEVRVFQPVAIPRKMNPHDAAAIKTKLTRVIKKK